MMPHQSTLDAFSRPLHAYLMGHGVEDAAAVRIATRFLHAHGSNAQAAIDQFLDAGWTGDEIARLTIANSVGWNEQPIAILEAERLLRDCGIDAQRLRTLIIFDAAHFTGDTKRLEENLAFLLLEGLNGKDIAEVARKFPSTLYLPMQRLLEMRASAASLEATPEERVGRLLSYLLNIRHVKQPRKPKKIVAAQKPEPEPKPESKPVPKEVPKKVVETKLPITPRMTAQEADRRSQEHEHSTTLDRLLLAYKAMKPKMDEEKSEAEWKAFRKNYPKLFSDLAALSEACIELSRWMVISDFKGNPLLGKILLDESLHTILHASKDVLHARMLALRSWIQVDFIKKPQLLLYPLEKIPPHLLRVRANALDAYECDRSCSVCMNLLLTPVTDATDATFKARFEKYRLSRKRRRVHS